MTMSDDRSFMIDGRSIYIHDGLLSESMLAKVGDRFLTSSFRRDESDGPDYQDVKTYNTDVEPDKFADDLKPVVVEIVCALFPERGLELMRVHCNATSYGDMVFPHRDCAVDRDDVTALLFVNPVWQREWGGETTFFDHTGDAVAVVTPRPGRLLVFEGAVEHRVGIPMRTCFQPRLSMAWKFKSSGEWR